MAKPEYIERDSALRVAHTMRPEDKCLEAAIANIPAADVAPVVRCCDCTYATLYEDSEGLYCTNICGLFTRVMDDDYCSYGERKDGGNEE